MDRPTITLKGCLRDLSAWQRPDTAPALGTEQVHLWTVDRKRVPTSVLTQAAIVSYKERERAGAYRFHRDRVRYIAARSVLRDLLAGYLEMDPAEVPLTQEPQGKPQLAPPNPTGIQFNLTHTDRFTQIAVTRRAAIGVDLEEIQPQPEHSKLARHILTEREQAEFDALPEHLKLDRFYQLWTMKEAVLKAFGAGFHEDPQTLELGVSLDPVEVRRMVFKGEDRGLWTLVRPSMAEGYKAAFAVEGSGWSLACWRWVGPLKC